MKKWRRRLATKKDDEVAPEEQVGKPAEEDQGFVLRPADDTEPTNDVVAAETEAELVEEEPADEEAVSVPRSLDAPNELRIEIERVVLICNEESDDLGFYPACNEGQEDLPMITMACVPGTGLDIADLLGFDDVEVLKVY